MMRLATRAWLGLAGLASVMGALLFLSAGTIRYWQAWVYLAVFVTACAVTTLDLLARDPALLERRMRGGPTAEKEPTQRVIMLFASAAFVALLVVPALDRRVGWSAVPTWLALVGDALGAAGFLIVGRVYRENTYTAATIAVEPGQTVIATGPYALVRHPMYTGALLYMFGTSPALGSYWGFAAFAVMLASLLWRLRDEERVLARELPGYAEYQQRVRYRLVPHVW
jgi:protein-S-isoprenylcysteine O-methyltransferase Ste14